MIECGFLVFIEVVVVCIVGVWVEYVVVGWYIWQLVLVMYWFDYVLVVFGNDYWSVYVWKDVVVVWQQFGVVQVVQVCLCVFDLVVGDMQFVVCFL